MYISDFQSDWKMTLGVGEVSRCVFGFSVVFLGQLLGSSPVLASSRCPLPCFCNPNTLIAYCSRRGLQSIPETIPDGTRQLNLVGNSFRFKVVQRQNFSRYDWRSLQQLHLGSCGIEDMASDCFADLIGLRWLDLSDNNITTVRRGAFRGLRLEHLFLNGNRGLRLERDSFEGTRTAGLYLFDCALTGIEPETVERLTVDGYLRKLWLNSNRIRRLDSLLLRAFSSLAELRLDGNPLQCDCDIAWLRELYETAGRDGFQGEAFPLCDSPLRLRGKSFEKLSPSDFRCSVPPFRRFPLNHFGGKDWLHCTTVESQHPSIQTSLRTGKPSTMSTTVAVRISPEAALSTPSSLLHGSQWGRKFAENGEFVVLAEAKTFSSPGSTFPQSSRVYDCSLFGQDNATVRVRLGQPSPVASGDCQTPLAKDQSPRPSRLREERNHSSVNATTTTTTSTTTIRSGVFPPSDGFTAAQMVGTVLATNVMTFAASVTLAALWSRHKEMNERRRRRQTGLHLDSSSVQL